MRNIAFQNMRISPKVSRGILCESLEIFFSPKIFSCKRYEILRVYEFQQIYIHKRILEIYQRINRFKGAF